MLFPISKQEYLNYASINQMAFHLPVVLSTILGITPGWQKSLCNLSLIASYVSSMLGLTIFLQVAYLASQQITDFDVKAFFMCYHCLLVYTFPHWRKKILHIPHYTDLLKICQTIICRACFSFAIYFSFGLYLWNVQSHSSPLVFEMCPHLIFPIFETISICSKFLCQIFPFS